MQRAGYRVVRGRHRPLSRRAAARAGVAMVEAMIAVPVFVVLLLGAMYLRELYLARAATRLTARSCAWTSALEGCPRDGAACSSTTGAAHDGQVPNIAEQVRARTGNSADPFRDVPIVRDALSGLFGSAITAEASRSVPYPFDDTRKGVARGETTVVCNSVPTDPISLAKELLCDHFPC